MPNGRPLKVANMYVPAQTQERKRFINRLALTSCFEGTKIGGTDAICVPNVRIDVKQTEIKHLFHLDGAFLWTRPANETKNVNKLKLLMP